MTGVSGQALPEAEGRFGKTGFAFMEQVEIKAHDLSVDKKSGLRLIKGKRLGKYRLQKTSLSKLVNEAVKLYKAEARRVGLDIEVLIKRPDEVEVSKDHFQFALNNIIHNAVNRRERTIISSLSGGK